MSRGEKAFSIIIRCVFILAFGAFLTASIHHVAVFFQNFEPSTPDNSVSLGSYALALSVDGTALMLTIGMMFFNKGMPWYAKAIVWAFIIGLTVFSWVVNWEYAFTYQAATLTKNLDPIWKDINPILASSFAFLNLAYSVVSEFFGTKEKTTEELKKELDGLTGERAQLQKQIREAKGPDIFDRTLDGVKNKALKAKKVAGEVLAKEDDLPSQKDAVNTDLSTLDHAQETEVKTERITTPLAHQNGSDNGTTKEIFKEEDEEPFTELSEEEYNRSYGTKKDQVVEPITESSGFLNILEGGSDTDPEMEVLATKSIPRSGSSTGRKSSTSQTFNRRKPMTVAEVAEELGCSERYVRDLRTANKLEVDDQGLIKAASVKSYLLAKAKKVRVS